MPDYKAMYYALFHKISEVIEQLQKIQLQAEELYISQSDANVTCFDERPKNTQPKHAAYKKRRST